jgi:hypothetical protein
MGMARLNVWMRDEDCKVLTNPQVSPLWDWVDVRYSAKTNSNLTHHTDPTNIVKTVTLPQGPAHVEIEVPPGMYVVAGHICTPAEAPGFNDYTDMAMVLAKGNEVTNVDLIVPTVGTCVGNILIPFVRAVAQLEPRVRPPDPQVQATVTTLLAAAQIRPEMVRTHLEGFIATNKLKVTEPLSKPYFAAVELLRKIPK